MMKTRRTFLRILCFILAFIIILFVVACDTGLKKDDNGETDGGNKTETETDENETDNKIINKNSRGEVIYENINGKTVTVNFYSRSTGDALYNPSFAGAEMINNAIKYKRQNPETEVNISVSSFHFSVVAAACIDEENENYGYMKSLYDCEYDNDGFVRISYLLVLAAKEGINVKVLGHLDANTTLQKNEQGGVYNRGDYSFSWYFEQHMNDDCNAQLLGKKVKDFLKCIRSEWTSYGDRAAADMMHYKLYAVSHLIDNKGNIQKNSIWLSSQNLDGIDYSGINSSNGLQTAVVINNHDLLYRCAINYFNLLFENQSQEDVYNFRDIMNARNNSQYEMYIAGRENEINPSEQILYLGSPSDKIFELYFTPLGSAAGAFDPKLNPYAKYSLKMLDSDDYILFSFLGVKYNECSFTNIWTQLINKAFVDVNNPNSKIFMSLDFTSEMFNEIIVGQNASFKNVSSDIWFHTKDVFVSWAKDDVRYYSVVLSSTNMHEGAFTYQANAMLVINENSDTGHEFFDLYTKINGFGMFDKY